jgi:hypothetical protein
MPTYPSQRPVKPEETHHRPLQSNLIGTLTINNMAAAAGAWAPGAAYGAFASLGPAMTAYLAAGGHGPLLWAMSSTNVGYEFKFGFDRQVVALIPAIGAAPLNAKIGHVALTAAATISGEIIQVGAHWELDNNSGAWGSMANQDGKSTMMDNAAQLISRFDPGAIVVTARRAYSRTGWKRKIQQVFR